MVYFLIGAENIFGGGDKTWARINAEIGNLASMKTQIDTEISQFKLSNIESLISSNELMLKMETTVEALLKKIERAYLDLTEGQAAQEFQVQTKTGVYNLTQYVQTFKWDSNTFSRNNLQELLKIFSTKTTTIDNDIRQKQQVLQEAKNNLNSVSLKEGNLVVKELSDVLTKDVVKPKDFIQSESLATVVLFVQKSQIENFLAQYQQLHHCVVPNSAKQFNVEEDKDSYTLWRVVVFKYDYRTIKKQLLEGDKPQDENVRKPKTPVEEFIILCREKLKITVKEFEYSEAESGERKNQRNQFQALANSQNGKLKQTCEKSFGNLYEVYIHLKQLRLVVEIAAKFGQKAQVSTCLIQPIHGKEKLVQQKLLKLFADPAQLSIGMYGTKEELEDTEDFFPYAYVPINI